MEDARTRLYIEANAICATHQSGIGHAVQAMVSALARHPEARRRHRIVLIAPLRCSGLLQQRGLGRIRRTTMPLPLRGYDRWAALPLLPPLDVLLGRGIYMFPNFGNWPLLMSPSLTFVHDLAFTRHPETVEQRTGSRLRANAERWARRTTRIVTPSAFSRHEVIECLHVEEGRVAVVPWGVDRGVFFPRPADEVQATRTRLGLPPDYVLYVGNIEPRKNLVRLIRAYGLLAPALKRAHPLVLVGSSSWRAEAIEAEIATAQSRGDPIVRIRHRVSDAELPAVFSGAAMLAHPALYEGFGLVPLQAMGCATPVLVGDRSAMPEIVGAAGAYVDPRDEDAITARMASLLTDTSLRAALIEAGTARVATFTWERSIASLLQVLGSVE